MIKSQFLTPFIITISLGLWGAVGFGQKQSPPSKEAAKPAAAQSDPAKKERIQLNVQERVKKKTEKVTKPESRRSAVLAVQIEKKLIDGIEKTTEYLEKTAASMPAKSAQRLQISEKILYLHMENATYLRNEEERLYDTQWQKWDADGRKGPEPKINSVRSNNSWKLVIAKATQINREYPRNRKADLVLFNKAIGLNYLGREKDAARILSELVTKFKGSDVAGDAYAALGDYYFDRNDFRNASSNFQLAMKFPNSQRYLWSIFKLGWCSYNLGSYQNALTYWKSAVAKGSGPQGEHIREEALRDMVYAFAELKQIDNAIAYYRANNSQKHIGTFLMHLGDILSDQGRYPEAIQVYQRFQTTVPLHEDGPTAQKEIIHILYLTGKFDRTWQQLENFFAKYGPDSAWSKHNKAIAAETTESIKDQMMYYATLSHQNAIKNKNLALNHEARKGYLLFLKAFPTSKEVPGVKFLLADIEYFLKNFQKAGQYYYEIAALGKEKALRFNPVKGSFENIHAPAAVEMVGSYVNDFASEFAVLKKRTPNFAKPAELSEKARNYIKACGYYVKWYPQDKARVQSCSVGIANVYHRLGIKDKAVKYLEALALNYSTTPEGPNAVKLVIPLVKDDKTKLYQMTTNFLKVPAYTKGEIGELLRNLRIGAEKDAILAEKDTIKRAQKLEEQAKKHPNDPDVDKLWYNAAVDYMKGGAINDSIRAHMVIVTRFSKTPQAQDSMLTIARIQEKTFSYEAASSSYLSFSGRYPKAAEALPALSKACALLVAINSSKAASVCIEFAKAKPDYALGHIETMIRGAFLSKDYAKMVEIITKVYLPAFKLSANQTITAWKKIYDASGGKGALANQAIQRIFSAYQASGGRVSGEALRAVGEFNLNQSMGSVGQFHRIKLKGGSVDALAGSIQQKAGALAGLQGQLKNVLSVKDPYSGVAVYVLLGQAYESLAEMLQDPPAIAGASKADVIKELTPQIQDAKKSANEWYKAATQLVNQYNVYNEFSSLAISGFARAQGRAFSFDDVVVSPDFIGNHITSQWVSQLRK